MGFGSIFSAGTNLLGGFAANSAAKKRQAAADEARRKAVGYMQDAWNYDPTQTGAGRAMADETNMSLGDYRQNAMKRLSAQYGGRGLLGSSMAVSDMGAGLEDAYHRQRVNARNALATYVDQAKSNRLDMAGKMASTYTDQATADQALAEQYGTQAGQSFGAAGNAIGSYLGAQGKRRVLDKLMSSMTNDEKKEFLKQNPSVYLSMQGY